MDQSGWGEAKGWDRLKLMINEADKSENCGGQRNGKEWKTVKLAGRKNIKGGREE